MLLLQSTIDIPEQIVWKHLSAMFGLCDFSVILSPLLSSRPCNAMKTSSDFLMEFIDFVHNILRFVIFFMGTGWTPHWRAQCNRCRGICARFDVRTRSNQSWEFSTLPTSHRLKPWPRDCWRYRRTKTAIRYLE